jgi:hypothetical protein
MESNHPKPCKKNAGEHAARLKKRRVTLWWGKALGPQTKPHGLIVFSPKNGQ